MTSVGVQWFRGSVMLKVLCLWSSLRDMKMQPHSLKKFVLCLKSAGEQLEAFAKTNCSVGELHESAGGCLLPHCTTSTVNEREWKGTLQNLHLTWEMPFCVMLDLSEYNVRSEKDYQRNAKVKDPWTFVICI